MESENIFSTKEPGKNYLIEGSVEFLPEINILYSRKTKKNIALLISASECFLLLLQRHGELITKNALIHAGWMQHGLHVSDKTFYQNILTVRKALKLSGIELEVVKTIPRKGLLIPKDIRIEALAPEMAEAMGNVARSPDSLNGVTKGQLTQPAENPRLSGTNSPRIKTMLRYLILSFIICAIGGGYVATPERYLSAYQYMDDSAGCPTYIDVRNTTPRIFHTFAKKHKISCQDGEALYFSAHQSTQRFSLIYCQQPLQDGMSGDCESQHYLDKQ